jgi:hypothetical protein
LTAHVLFVEPGDAHRGGDHCVDQPDGLLIFWTEAALAGVAEDVPRGT